MAKTVVADPLVAAAQVRAPYPVWIDRMPPEIRKSIDNLATASAKDSSLNLTGAHRRLQEMCAELKIDPPALTCFRILIRKLAEKRK